MAGNKEKAPVAPASKKPAAPQPSLPLIVAHRGASAQAPENTLPAFHLAWKMGADAIEGDFHLTRDGEIICLHDKDTKRVTGKATNLVVRKSTLAELVALDIGNWLDPKWKDTKIPTLAAVLATVPKGKKIYVEIKCGPEILPQLMKTLKASGLVGDQIVIISFQAEVIAGYKKLVPQGKAYWLSNIEQDGLARGKPRMKPSMQKILTTLKQCKADGLGSSKSPLVTKELVRALRKSGFEHHVWTVDDPKTARRFRDLGSRSITTNKPDVIRKALEQGPREKR